MTTKRLVGVQMQEISFKLQSLKCLLLNLKKKHSQAPVYPRMFLNYDLQTQIVPASRQMYWWTRLYAISRPMCKT